MGNPGGEDAGGKGTDALKLMQQELKPTLLADLFAYVCRKEPLLRHYIPNFHNHDHRLSPYKEQSAGPLNTAAASKDSTTLVATAVTDRGSVALGPVCIGVRPRVCHNTIAIAVRHHARWLY